MARELVMRFSRSKLIIFATVMLIIAIISILRHTPAAEGEPVIPAPMAPHEDMVGGIGIIEPKSENINIGTHLPGVVQKVYVTAGQKVKVNDPLFTIDNRDTLAELALAKAKLHSATIKMAEKKNQLTFYENISDKRAISAESLSDRRYAYQLAQAEVAEAEANISVLESKLDRLTVKAPIQGTVLKVNVRPGEYAEATVLSDPLMVIGDTSVLHVRVEVDESDIARIMPHAKAIGYLRGMADKPIPLKFVKSEPLAVTKKSLTNNANEVVDTRVTQLIYAVQASLPSSYIGQHLDVFIEAKPLNKKG